MSDLDTASTSSGSVREIDPATTAALSTRPIPPLRSSSHHVRRSSISPSGQPQDDSYDSTEHGYNSQRRNNMLAMDRKRRLTSSATDSGRRRHRPSGSAVQELSDSDSGSAGNETSTAHSRQAQVIDLTNSPSSDTPRPRPQPQPNRTSSTSSRRYMVPRWQPDSEVNDCPICHKPFTWLFRRHHCRKCGRVVCSECSPHRITIPRQFIVNPPDVELLSVPDGSRQSEAIDLTADDDDDEQFNRPARCSFIEGGEKVRLCNPCVPDPQPDPPPNFPPQRVSPSQSPTLPSHHRPHTNILGQVSRNQYGQGSHLPHSTSVPNRGYFGARPALQRVDRPRSTATFDDILNGMDNSGSDSQRFRSSSMVGAGSANVSSPSKQSQVSSCRPAAFDKPL